MSRPIVPRANFRDDASFLIRLEKAVEVDEKRAAEWREETCRLIRVLVLRLLEGSDLVASAPSVLVAPLPLHSKKRV